MSIEQHQSYLEKTIIFCLLAFSLTFFIEEKIADIFIRAGFLLILIYKLKQPSVHFNWEYYKPYLLPLIIFYLGLFFLNFFSSNFSRSILTYEAWVKMLIPFLAVLLFATRKNTIKLLCITVLFSLSINNLCAIYQYFFCHIPRAGGFNNDVIGLSNLLLIQLPIFFLLTIKKSSAIYYKIFYILLSCIGIITLFVNGTRMVWFIIIIDILLLSFFLIKGWRKKLTVVLCFIILLTGLYNFNTKIYTRVNKLFNTNDVSTRGHFFYMRDGFRLFLHNFYFGVGLDNFQTAILDQNLISPESKENLKHDMAAHINNTLVIPHAHNELVMFLSQFGIIGGILYILLYGSILLHTFKNWRYKNNFIDLSMLFITINFLLHGLDEYNFGNLGAMTIYFFIWGLYLLYTHADNGTFFARDIEKKYIIYPYVFILFIVLLRITSRYLAIHY
ncbi:O-antigen ligase family protein [Pectinatus sottacetonis]|uniref:O-antigen ligase family protein n=1 Tax=Pectinatus sottacetonis TaxID=1002795 RepID=UPI0018C71CF4|nr:O-antigen ligase family protein [Pectinatus sottacetonis]